MVQQGNSTPNLRHIDLKWWFANHHVELGHVSVHPVRTDKNAVNALTKCVTGSQFLAARSYMLGLPPFTAASAQLLSSFRRVPAVMTGLDEFYHTDEHLPECNNPIGSITN